MSARILVCDPIPEDGPAVLRRAGLSVDIDTGLSPATLEARVEDYDGLVVRSATKVRAPIIEAAGQLKVIGRAGVGVDNIDLDVATKHGIVVMNTPGGSAVTVAEHTLALMLALARNIPAATASVKAGRWEKKRFRGHELSGKVLGVIGIGNIGSMVVKRARAFGMQVKAYDPFTSAEAAAKLGAELVDLDEVIRGSDVVSLHVPLTDDTRHLINAEKLSQMKAGAYLINAARGGVVDEHALAESLAQGHLGGAALDVFEVEPPGSDHPLLRFENFVCAPHLGASTQEAQAKVAVMLAEQLVAFFRDGSIRNAVNVPSVSREMLEALGPWLQLATRVGEMAAQLVPANPDRVDVAYTGTIAGHDLRPITHHLLSGFLRQSSAEPINAVNAPFLARERGIRLSQTSTAEDDDYVATIGVNASGPGGGVNVVGTVSGKHSLRIVRVDDFKLDAVPEGNLLVLWNEDVPKIVGRIGSILGDADINIGRIHLSRSAPRGQAFSIFSLDSKVPAGVMERLRAVSKIQRVKQFHL